MPHEYAWYESIQDTTLKIAYFSRQNFEVWRTHLPQSLKKVRQISFHFIWTNSNRKVKQNQRPFGQISTFKISLHTKEGIFQFWVTDRVTSFHSDVTRSASLQWLLINSVKFDHGSKGIQNGGIIETWFSTFLEVRFFFFSFLGYVLLQINSRKFFWRGRDKFDELKRKCKITHKYHVS